MLSIHDVFGRIVRNEVAISDFTTEVGIAGLAPGMYVVRISGRMTGIPKKLVVK